MSEVELRPVVEGAWSDKERLYTRSIVPGTRVYGERLIEVDGVEYREWVPYRSKLAAYLMKGGREFPFTKRSRVLYLGAASGTTASHVADICSEGTVFCVEISQRSFRELVSVCEKRKNMVPILSDATKPSGYRFVVDRADVVYQDVAQKNQASILTRNMDEFQVAKGMLALKARSEDVTSVPEEVFERARRGLVASGLKVIEVRDLGPYEKDHAMMVVSR
ncbi:MAG: fibrillarin-like rRNA/tRNA 2'-O-methyltransferase [Methanomassiliicoccales archaeon]|jgi:fibrillarin-like pre-rRNA processing protein